jgi:general stress protein 26
MTLDPEKTIDSLIDKQGVCFIASIDQEGFPNMKAMLTPRRREGLHTLWFTTNVSAMRTAQFRENPKASVYFYDKRFFRGLMLVGTMEILYDAASKEMIWREGDTMYYKQGVTDPDYCVLRFTSARGRYYTDFSSEDFTLSRK